MIPVRQSTAFETAIGPVLDAAGVAVTDCVVGDFKIKKTSGDFAAINGSATLTHVSAGTYDLVLTTSDVDTVGLCCIAIDDTVNACAPLFLQVVEEAVYDAFYAASANGVPAAGATSAQATAIEADTQDLQTQIGTAGAGLTDIPKTGYKLASDGLDVIDATIPSAVATTFPGFVKQLWSRFMYKSTLSSTELITYASDGTTVVTTQTVSDTGTLQTQGKAS